MTNKKLEKINEEEILNILKGIENMPEKEKEPVGFCSYADRGNCLGDHQDGPYCPNKPEGCKYYIN